MPLPTDYTIMKLAQSKRSRLEKRGWNLVLSRADRPSAVPHTDILHVGEDFVTPEQPDEGLPLFDLDELR